MDLMNDEFYDKWKIKFLIFMDIIPRESLAINEVKTYSNLIELNYG